MGLEVENNMQEVFDGIVRNMDKQIERHVRQYCKEQVGNWSNYKMGEEYNESIKRRISIMRFFVSNYQGNDEYIVRRVNLELGVVVKPYMDLLWTVAKKVTPKIHEQGRMMRNAEVCLVQITDYPDSDMDESNAYKGFTRVYLEFDRCLGDKR